MATTSSVVDKLEKIYDEEYRPKQSAIFASVPKESQESSIHHSFRVAHLARDDIELDAKINSACSSGLKFIRYFNEAYQSEQTMGFRSYLNQSGLARLCNVFVMIFPYEVSKYRRCSNEPFSADISDLYKHACPSALTTEVWKNILLPEWNRSVDPFPEATMKVLINLFE